MVSKMQGRMLLLMPFAACIAHAAVAQDDIDLLYACEDLTIDTDTGVLSGECYVGKHPALTSVDLKACLGWGSLVDPRKLHEDMPAGSRSGLVPVKNPEGADFKIEYSLDLTNVVSVTDNGCLQCMGASGDCAPEVPLETFRRFAFGGLESDGFNDVEALLDWLELRSEAARTPCEAQIIAHPQFIPETFPNTTYHRCKEDHSFCCYQARGSRCSTRFEAFLLIEANKYWYRIHYTINFRTLEIESPAAVFQLCQYPGQCEEESPPDNTSGVVNCTWNPLERYESRIYDNDLDALYSDPQPPRAIASPLVDVAIERMLPA
ncbi:hypothetical protein SLS53_007505 [Cytospora paraplurivora]|uniref:Uncharacterized protein n=1 Tax=Cytospora paraplurivora TaxID=2898453 RepID=A0AAN9YD43_9PEZI